MNVILKKIIFLIYLASQISISFCGLDLSEDYIEVEPNTPIFINEDSSKLSLNGIETIYFDLRKNARGGNGDIAASFLMAHEFILRHDFKGKIYFLVDTNSKMILSILSGKNIINGSALYKENLICYEKRMIPNDGTVLPADMIIYLAKLNGTRINSSETYISQSSKNSNTYAWIPVKKNTFYVFQTVLGNTENKIKNFNFSSVFYKGLSSLMEPAGLDQKEAGIYWDHIAIKLRGKKKEEIAKHLKSLLQIQEKNRDNLIIESLLSNQIRNSNMKVGLVYGVSSADVSGQFKSYLDGLSKLGEKSGNSYTIITPSKIDQNIFSKNNVTVFPMGSPININKLKSQRGHINIIATGNLTHEVFTALLAYSEFVPIISGDAALSAAILIGKPFTMTKVSWNSKNIENLVKLLELDSTFQPTVQDEKFWGNYINAKLGNIVNNMNEFKNRFPKLKYNITFLSDQILKALHHLLELESNSLSLEEIKNISNDTHRMYKLFQLFSKETAHNNNPKSVISQIITEPHHKFIYYLVENTDEAKKSLKNKTLFNHLKDVLAFRGVTDDGVKKSNLHLFDTIFPALRGVISDAEIVEIIEHILVKKILSEEGRFDQSYFNILLKQLIAINSKESVQLIEKYFLPLKDHAYTTYQAFTHLMLSEHSIFMKDTVNAFTYILNHFDNASFILGKFLQMRMAETGLLPTVYAWKLIEFLKRPKLVFLMYKNNRPEKNYPIRLTQKQRNVLEISNAAEKFFEENKPPINTCKILMH